MRRRRIDQCLPRMSRMHGVRENALPGMKRVGALRRKRFFMRRACSGFGFLPGNFQERKILNRPGPNKLRVFKQQIFARPRKLRKWHHHESEVPQRGRDHSAHRHAPLHPAIPEKRTFQVVLRSKRTPKENAQAARQTRMEISPGYRELWLQLARQVARRFRSRFRWGFRRRAWWRPEK